MSLNVEKRPSSMATVVFGLLDPIPFGMFVGALIFDATYANSAVVMWFKSAAWLIVIGLSFAVIPRLINLAWVWFPGARVSTGRDKTAFFLYLFGVVAAIVNAFVHSRDAYAIVPEGLWLSILTVVLLALSYALVALQSTNSNYRVQA
jgi:uncharacterized membrane protein